jgi:RND family efflux transporter MFP subunit
MNDTEFSSEKSAPRRRRLWPWVFILAVAAAAAVGIGGYRAGWFGGHPNEEKVAEGVKYTCGMHPWIIADKPGDCPICGMTLTRIEPQAEAAPAAPPSGGGAEDFFAEESPRKGGPRKLLFYRNPMNPMVTSPVPMKDEMGMDYVPVYEEEAVPSSGAVPGYAVIRVGEEAIQLTGVRTEAAVTDAIRRTVRTVGTVVSDETRVRRVQTKIGGWIEKLHVNFTGQQVSAGRPVLDLYSPELLASQQEFLRAGEAARKLAASPSEEVRTLGKELVASARKRLELYDVPGSFIDELERTGKPRRSVTLNAPISGYVTSKDAFEGQKVEPEMELFTVTDLSRVWIEADLYESEARTVRVGQEAEITLPYEPGVTIRGKVAFVEPTLSMESRTLKARFEFPNKDLALKPQMFADVTLALESARGVVIPDSAVIDTGLRKVVFVETAQGTFTPREVVAGLRGEGKTLVLSGVREGEAVVVKANFLLDSESRLRAALNRAMETQKN